MKKKAATYALLAICLASLLLDIAFAIQATRQLQQLSVSEATVSSVGVDRYRLTTKIPNFEVVSGENSKERLYQKFGSFSLRWLFQSLPQEQDQISYYKLDYTDDERGNYIVGIGVNQKCSSFKLWLDIYASYAYNTVLFLLNYIGIFLTLASLGQHWEYNLLNKYFNTLVIYSFLKLIFFTLGIW